MFLKDGHNGAEINLTAILHKNTTKLSINGISTKALVDTGAGISQSFVKKITVKRPELQKSHIYSIVGVGQQRLRIMGIVNLTIKINDKNFNIDFHGNRRQRN